MFEIDRDPKCMPVEELVKMTTSKLAKVIKKCEAKTTTDGGTLYIYDDMVKTKFDVELDEDFGRDVFMYFEPSMLDSESDNDGWYDRDLEVAYAKLLSGWNWDDAKLKDGRTVIITECEDSFDISIHIVNSDNIVDGAIESKYWLGISVNPLN